MEGAPGDGVIAEVEAVGERSAEQKLVEGLVAKKSEEEIKEEEKKKAEEAKEQEKKDAKALMMMILEGSQESQEGLQDQPELQKNELLQGIDPKVFEPVESDTAELKETRSTLRKVYDQLNVAMEKVQGSV